MLISGFQKLTLLDYPGKLAATIFTPGCQFKCHYCHNPELSGFGEKELIKEDEILQYLKKRKKLLEGVAITGGEPTLQKDLKEFIKKIKEMEFLVKLDTNGANPEILEDLINEKLLDYIAMDIKASFDNYDEVVGIKVDKEKLKKSMELIMNYGKDYEFRTTVMPEYHNEEEIQKIGQLVEGAKILYLQQFRNEKTLDPEFGKKRMFTRREMEKLSELLKPYIKDVKIRM